MKNRKATILALCLGLVATLSLVACGGNENAPLNSDSSGHPVKPPEQPSQGDVFADEVAWAQALQTTAAKTNAVMTVTAVMEERSGEYFMKEEGVGTMQLADGKMYQRGEGTYSYHYLDGPDGDTLVTGEEEFETETYMGVVDGAVIEWSREVGAEEWDCSSLDYVDFNGTTGSAIEYLGIPFSAFADMYSQFQNENGTYILELTPEETEGEIDCKIEMKFVDGLLYSLVWDMTNVIDKDTPDGGTVFVGTDSSYISLVIEYDSATVGELPPMTWDGEDGPNIPSKPETCEHSFSEYYSNNDATCTEDGTKTAWCDYGCGKTDTITDEGSAIDHSFTDYVSNNDATCTEDGTKTAWCDYGCGKSDTVTDEGSAIDHSFTDYVSNNDATCTEDGTKTAKCDNGCGESKTVTDEGTATDHSFTDYVSNNDATCTENGTKTAKCDNGCGKTDTVTDKGSATGHSFTDYKTDDSGKQTAVCDNACGATDVKGEALLDEAAWKKAIADSAGKINATIGYVSVLEAEDEYGNYLGQKGNATAKIAEGAVYELVTGMTTMEGPAYYEEPFMRETYVGYVDNLAMQWYRESDESAWECAPFNVDGAEFTGTLGEFMTRRSVPLAYFADMFAVFTYEDGTYVYETDITDNGEVGRIELKFLGGLLYSYEQTVTVQENVEGIDGDGVAYMNFIISYDDASVMELPPMTWEIPESVGLRFALNADEKSYSVTGIGNCEDGYIVIPKMNQGLPVTMIAGEAFANCTVLTDIVIPDSVTEIGPRAFSGCTGLTDVLIPGSVTKIGTATFSSCTNLKKVHIQDIAAWCNIDFGGYTANPLCYAKSLYRNNAPITTIEVPDGVTGISPYAFYNYQGLTKIVVPGSVESIGKDAFSQCNDLKGVYITDLSAWCNVAFGGYTANPLYYAKNLYINGEVVSRLEIPEGVTKISSCAFYGGSGLTEVILSNSVTSIGDNAFSACWNLTDVIMPDGVTSIGDNAFSACKGLTEIAISDSIESISNTTFSGCNNLQYNVKDGLKYLGNEQNLYVCLMGMENDVESVVIESGCKVIATRALSDCRALLEVVIPESITHIGKDAFKNCDVLIIYCVAVSRPNEWTTAWNSSNSPVVWDCNNNAVADDGYMYVVVDGLRYGIKDGEAIVAKQIRTVAEATIPSEIVYQDVTYNVTGIGNTAFAYCSGLTKIIIPDSVTSIGEGAFFQCSGLEQITIPNSVTSIGQSAFNGCEKLQYKEENRLKYLGNEENPYFCLVGPTDRQIVTATVADDCKMIIASAFEYCEKLTSVHFSENSRLVNIGKSAFSGCSNLVNLTIPDSVISIEDEALFGCSGLEEITCPAFALSHLNYRGVYGRKLKYVKITAGDTIPSEAFAFCNELKKVILADSVTTIGNDAFHSCTALTTVSLGENSQLQSIGIQAFYNCIALTQIALPDSLTSIGESAFMDCRVLTEIVIPDGVTTIEDNAFALCSKLSRVTLGTGVTSIGKSAFQSCGLTEIVIPDSVQTIGEFAFGNCSALARVTFGENSQLTSIGKSAFSGCALTELTLPDSIIEIGDYAFQNCNSLTKIVIPDSLASIGSAFYGCNNLKDVTCPASAIESLTKAKLQKVVITSGESIGDSAFGNCAQLTEVEICDGITSIGKNAFQNCSKITKLSIPNSVTSIGYGAFYGCSGLTEIIIPDGVTEIGGSAFSYCSGVSEILIPDSVQTIGDNAFYPCSSLQHNVKDGLRYLGNKNNPYIYLMSTESMDIASANIADGCKFIASKAFQHRKKLCEVIIPNSVTSIGTEAFYNCTSLTEITIPSKVTTIGASAFNVCRALKTFTFDGTMEQWGVVEKGTSWNLSTSIKKVICNDGEVTL